MNPSELMNKVKLEIRFMPDCTQGVFGKVVLQKSQGTVAQLVKAGGKGERFTPHLIKIAKFFARNSPSQRRKLYTDCRKAMKNSRAPDKKFKVPDGQGRYKFTGEQKKVIRDTYKNSSFTMENKIAQLVESVKAPEASIRIFIKNDKAKDAQRKRAEKAGMV